MFSLQSNVFYGPGSTSSFIDYVQSSGFKAIAVLIDEAVASSAPPWEILRQRLRVTRGVYEIFLNASGEPTYDYLDAIAEEVRALPPLDLLIGIGGGSAMDLAKAAAALTANDGPALTYRGFDLLERPGPPVACIPTTAGTGSEVTVNAVFIDRHERRKLGINGRFMSPAYSVLDAHWLTNCPRSIALSSGLDALVHTLESFMTRAATDLTRAYSRTAFDLIYRNLPGALARPFDEDANQKMLLASHLAAIALFNSGSGISGAMSYPLGVHYSIPHGIAGGITLPSVIDFNIQQGWLGFAELLSAPEMPHLRDQEAAAIQLLEALNDLYSRIGVPTNFDSWGLTMSDLDDIAREMENLQAAFDQNPIPFSASVDAPELLARHLSPSQ